MAGVGTKTLRVRISVERIPITIRAQSRRIARDRTIVARTIRGGAAIEGSADGNRRLRWFFIDVEIAKGDVGPARDMDQAVVEVIDTRQPHVRRGLAWNTGNTGDSGTQQGLGLWAGEIYGASIATGIAAGATACDGVHDHDRGRDVRDAVIELQFVDAILE